jgi:glucosamine-phosphate N-acetyltransferase
MNYITRKSKSFIHYTIWSTEFEFRYKKFEYFTTKHKKQYIELLSQLTNSPIITDEEFINKVNEISKIGTIIVCYIRNTDKIIGSGTIIYEPKIIHGGKSVGHIEDIIVDKNYRNKGIAKNILNMLVNLAK